MYSQHFYTQVCFLVNKILSLSSWLVNYLQSDLVTLILQLKDHVLYIHNIYLELSDMLNIVLSNFLIYSLRQLLDKSDKHLILSNFNLHYLSWEDVRCLIRYYMTDDLVRITNEVRLQLLTSSNIITWENYRSVIMMNLVFTFLWLI